MRSFRCQGLRKVFDGSEALADIDLEFRESGITALIGPNGAGKTTLFNVLTGFLQPDEGRHFLGHRETTGLLPHQIARLGVARTFQDLRLILQVSVLDSVLVACPNQRGERLWSALLRFGVKNEEERIHSVALRLLRFVGLGENTSQLVSELSYGQQKLLTLACCLATEAPVLLLDEPVAGVHREMVTRILGLLRELRNAGKLVVFIEHDISAVSQVADWVIVMDHGNIIAQGPPTQVLDRPEIIEAYLA